MVKMVKSVPGRWALRFLFISLIKPPLDNPGSTEVQ